MKWFTRISFVLICCLTVFSPILSEDYGWQSNGRNPEKYSRDIVTLDSNIDRIHFRRSGDTSKEQVLVFLANHSVDFYLRVLCEKLCPSLSLLGYETNRTWFSGSYDYNKEKIRHYLKNRQLATDWPPFYREPGEISRELGRGNYTRKHLLVTGRQSNLLLSGSMQRDFDSFIMISPDLSLLELAPQAFAGRKLLWVGTGAESWKISEMRSRFGGDTLIYSRSRPGEQAILGNMKLLDDLLNWITNNS